MMSDNLNFSLRNVATQEEAQEIQVFLEKEGVESKISIESGDLAPVFIGNAPTNKFEILISENDIEIANALFLNWAESTLEDIPKDYHLYKFNDAELTKILVESDEWNETDVLLAKRILKNRKVELDESVIQKDKKLRKVALQKPESGQTVWIIVGYILSLLSGFFGILIGYALWQAKKRLPDGSKVPAYDTNVRTHGQIIFYISIAIFASALLLRLFGIIVFL
jgi:hypothetical protein